MTAYVVSFEDYTPGARLDGRPWTQVRIEESDVVDGVYTEIQVIDLSPVDADPSQPRERSFTTSSATLPSGWYRITWLDDIGGEQPTPPIHNVTLDYLPTVEEVGALLRARTKDTNGNELGTFTAATRPTHDEVADRIQRSTAELVDAVGLAQVEAMPNVARSVVALEVACFVEGSYFPEQMKDNQSVYPQYDALRRERLQDLFPVQLA